MASNNESTMKWKVDITQLKAAMQEAKRSISQANAEFKTATAGMDKWSKSTEGLEAKLEQLNKVLPAQKRQLEVLEQQYKDTVAKMGENSSAAADLKLKIEDQKAAIVKTESSIDKYNGQLADMKAKQAEADSETGKLSKTIQDQEAKLTRLKKEYANAVLQYGENSDEAKELAKQIETLSGDLVENKKTLSDAEKAADEFDSSIADAGNSAEEAGKDADKAAKGGFTVLRGAMAELVAEGINKVIEGLKDLAKTAIEAWKEFDKGSDIIIAKTGATGKAAEDLQQVYKNVSKQVVGSYDEIGNAVGEVSTRFDLSGDELEDLSIQFIKFAQLNGTDVKNSIDKVQGSLAAWGMGAEDAGNMLDILNKAGQDTGVSVDTLADALKTNAPALQEMGYSAADAAFFLANLDKNGVDSSATMTGLKKALQTAAKEGKPMGEAMSDMEKRIKDAKSSTDAIKVATELFGKSAGPAIAKAVRDGKLSFEDLNHTMEEFQGNVTDTFEATQDAPDKFALAVQGIKTDLADLVGNLMEKYAPQINSAIETVKSVLSGFFGAVETIVDFVIENGDTIVDIIKAIAVAVGIYLAYTTALKIFTEGWMALEVVQKAVAVGQAALNAVMSANPIGLVVAAVAALVAAFVALWNKSEAFRQFWINLWEKVKSVAEAAWKFIQNVWEVVSTWFNEKVIMPIKNFFTGMWDGLKDGAKKAWEGIKSVFGAVADWFKNIFSKAWQAVKDVFSTGGKIFEGIKDGIVSAFKTVVNAIIRGINKVIAIPFNAINSVLSKIRDVSILGFEPFSWIKTFNVPQIPLLAKGGVLKRGQIGLLEGNGAEAVVPLERNKQWIAAVVKEMVSQMNIQGLKGTIGGQIAGINGISGGYGSMTQNVTFNQTINSPKAVDRLTIYRNTNSLLFSAKVGLGNV